MVFYKNNKAFTLIELVVGITILGILAFAIANIDFNRLSNAQKLDIFAGKIKTSYESVRNNALSGKGVGVNLVIPDKWVINFSKTNSGTISWVAYDKDNSPLDQSIIIIPNDFTIDSIKCGEYGEDRGNYDPMTFTGTIEFNGINIKLNTNGDLNCEPNKDKVLELNIKNKVENKIININTLNGLIEIK